MPTFTLLFGSALGGTGRCRRWDRDCAAADPHAAVGGAAAAQDALPPRPPQPSRRARRRSVSAKRGARRVDAGRYSDNSAAAATGSGSGGRSHGRGRTRPGGVGAPDRGPGAGRDGGVGRELGPGCPEPARQRHDRRSGPRPVHDGRALPAVAQDPAPHRSGGRRPAVRRHRWQGHRHGSLRLSGLRARPRPRPGAPDCRPERRRGRPGRTRRRGSFERFAQVCVPLCAAAARRRAGLCGAGGALRVGHRRGHAQGWAAVTPALRLPRRARPCRPSRPPRRAPGRCAALRRPQRRPRGVCTMASASFWSVGAQLSVPLRVARRHASPRLPVHPRSPWPPMRVGC